MSKVSKLLEDAFGPLPVVDVNVNITPGSFSGEYRLTFSNTRIGEIVIETTDAFAHNITFPLGYQKVMLREPLFSGPVAKVDGKDAAVDVIGEVSEKMSFWISGIDAIGAGATAPSMADIRAGKGVIKKGMEGDSVFNVQLLLEKAVPGALFYKKDAKFEEADKQRTMAFQNYKGFKGKDVDGIVGKNTLAALEGDPVANPNKSGSQGLPVFPIITVPAGDNNLASMLPGSPDFVGPPAPPSGGISADAAKQAAEADKAKLEAAGKKLADAKTPAEVKEAAKEVKEAVNTSAFASPSAKAEATAASNQASAGNIEAAKVTGGGAIRDTVNTDNQIIGIKPWQIAVIGGGGLLGIALIGVGIAVAVRK